MSDHESANSSDSSAPLPPAPLAPIPDRPPPVRPRSWAATLLQLWRLQRPDGAPAGSPVPAIVVQSALWLTLWLAIDRSERQPEPRLTADGIPLLAWYVLGVFALAGLLRSRSRPAPPWAALLAIAAGLVPVVLVLVTLGGDYLTAAQYLGTVVLVALYAGVYLARGLETMTGRSHRAAAAGGVLFIALFVWASDRLDVIPDLFNPREAAETAASGEAPDTEALLFGQVDRIDEALAAVHRGAAAAPEGYFVGFAGVGDQRVFADEIALAQRVLGSRYGLDDRSLALINDQRDLDTAPLATVSGLRYALRGIGMRMNPERDVLFLAISSHGSEDGTIDVENTQLPLDSLTVEDLDEALRDSGIQWRVIIISACYAGAFLDPLHNPQTIIITAAAADRSSFGCSNDRDLTYFGEAFYRDALPHAQSLRDAFNVAAAAIAAREHREGITPSNPQAYFGAQIETRLAALQAGAGSGSHAATIVRALPPQ